MRPASRSTNNAGPMSIGKLSAATGLSRSTIRYYERRGLLEKPNRRRSGYRSYSSEHVQRLQIIRRAKMFGFTLGEIMRLLEAQTSDNEVCDILRDKAQLKLEMIEQEIKRLESAAECLRESLDDCTGPPCTLLNPPEHNSGEKP